MRQTHTQVSLGNKQLRGIFGDHYIVMPAIKVKKADVESLLVNGVLPAGVLLTKEGKPVTTTAQSTDAFGVNYTDVDFNNMVVLGGNLDRCASVSIFVHGVLNEKYIKFDAAHKEIEKAALKQIIFI